MKGIVTGKTTRSAQTKRVLDGKESEVQRVWEKMGGKWEKSGGKRKKMKGRDLKYGEGEKGERVAGVMLA